MKGKQQKRVMLEIQATNVTVIEYKFRIRY